VPQGDRRQLVAAGGGEGGASRVLELGDDVEERRPVLADGVLQQVGPEPVAIPGKRDDVHS
jgi:hypothetical protein